MFQLGTAPKVQDMAISEKTFVQRFPDPTDTLAGLLAQTNAAFLEQRKADCEAWICRVYALLDKEHSCLSAQAPHPELSSMK